MTTPNSRPSIEAIARDLTADPPRPVDPEVLEKVDPDELRDALRRRVQGLDPAARRSRLAAAFSVLSAATTAPAGAGTAETDPRPSPRPAMRVLTPVRVGLASALVVASIVAGAVVGHLTDRTVAPSATPSTGPNPEATELAQVVEPIAFGDPPTKRFVRDHQAAVDAAADAATPDADPDTGPGAPAQPPTDDAGSAPGDPDPVGTDDPGAALPGGESGLVRPREPEATEAGPEGNDDRPALVDLCASPTPPEGCGDGVGGTVTAAYIRPFELLDPPEAWVSNPCEGAAGPVPEDQFVFYLQATYLADYTIRYRPLGTEDPFTEVTGTSDAEWREALDAGYGAVLDCITAPRPAGEYRGLTVEVIGHGLDDSGEDRFFGAVDLGPPSPESTVERRAGRPPVQVTALTSSALEVIVPLGRNEDAEVTLIPSAPGRERSTCAVTDPRDAIEASPVPVRLRPGSDEITLEWTPRRYRVAATDAGHWAVCVTWLDDGVPPAQLERAALPVDIASVDHPRIGLGGFLPATEDGQPDSMSLRISRPDGTVCGSAHADRAEFDYAPESNPPTLCELTEAADYVVALLTGYWGEETRTMRAVIEVPGTCAADEERCRAWVFLDLRDEEQHVVGTAVISIDRPRDGRDSVVIGDERPVLAEEPEIDGPRLRWNQVSVEPHPRSPSTALQVKWATDVPARAVLIATPRSDVDACPIRRKQVQPTDRGTAMIGGLCPGVEYLVAFYLVDEERRLSTLYDVNGSGNIRGADLVTRSALGRTRPLEALFDYRLEFELTRDGEPFNAGIVPTWLQLGFPTGPDHADHDYQWSQLYDGTARGGLDCSVAAHYDRAGSNVPTTVSGGTLGPDEGRWVFHPYGPIRVGLGQTTVGGWSCPSLYNQVHHTPSDPRLTCAMLIDHLTPQSGTNRVLQLLSGRPGVYEGSGRCGREVEMHVRLVVTLRQVPAVLRGG